YLFIHSAIAGALLSVLIVRADIVHFMYLEPLFLLPLAFIADPSSDCIRAPRISGNSISGTPSRFLRRALAICLALCFLPLGAALFARPVSAPFQTETRRGPIATAAPDTVIAYVQQNTAAGEPVLVYPYLPLYYFLTGTRSISRYEYIQP